jgi:hypothetical protein
MQSNVNSCLRIGIGGYFWMWLVTWLESEMSVSGRMNRIASLFGYCVVWIFGTWLGGY